MIIDGRKLATRILAEVRTNLFRPLTVQAIVVMPSPATRSYLSVKAARAKDAGMELSVIELSHDASTAHVIEAVEKSRADALIVQLPLPPHIDTPRVLNAIPEEQDADVLSSASYDAFSKEVSGALVPPVAGALSAILTEAGIDVKGKRAVVIGKGRLVGEPCATLLRHKGAEVTVLTKEDGDLSLLKQADIIVSGAGQPGLIRPEHIRSGVVLIDAGTSESDGAIVGDADPACADIASVFTPVPGGVGPIAVACLFANAARLQSK